MFLSSTFFSPQFFNYKSKSRKELWSSGLFLAGRGCDSWRRSALHFPGDVLFSGPLSGLWGFSRLRKPSVHTLRSSHRPRPRGPRRRLRPRARLRPEETPGIEGPVRVGAARGEPVGAARPPCGSPATARRTGPRTRLIPGEPGMLATVPTHPAPRNEGDAPGTP